MLEAGGQPGWARDDGGRGGGPGRRRLQLQLRLLFQCLAGFLFQHGPVIGPLPGRAETCILGEGSLGRLGRGLTGVRDQGKAGRLGKGSAGGGVGGRVLPVRGLMNRCSAG